ncbi:hypothetical protein BT69DRAFT_1336608 [Atractiella rhizophila]|nr:hypothetical protein BT69DRAFT_1336608 [Atractiella rhizophila]
MGSPFILNNERDFLHYPRADLKGRDQLKVSWSVYSLLTYVADGMNFGLSSSGDLSDILSTVSIQQAASSSPTLPPPHPSSSSQTLLSPLQSP